MNRLIPFIALALLVFQLAIGVGDSKQIVNVHESVETIEDVAKLQSAMSTLGISDIVLHGIPEAFLRYSSEEEIDLSAVGVSHEVILEAVETYPGEFHYVCSINPEDENKEAQLEQCIEDGAVGVKFYVGYTVSHTCSVDDPALDDFFNLVAEANLFLMLPVNTAKFGEEFDNFLDKNPDIPVVCPHYCLSSKNLDALSERLDTHPNLYVDTSFGSTELVESGFTRMTENHEEFAAFFENYQDRIVFATDNVITSYEDKTEEWVQLLYSDYLSMMTEGEFSSALNAEITYLGLELPLSTQQKVFWRNWTSLIE